MNTSIYDKLHQIYHMFLEKEETQREGKDGNIYRTTNFILPDTVFFTYGYGIRTCTIFECQNYVRVYYGTIDDSAMAFNVYVNRHEEVQKTYDILSKILHLEDEDRITGLSYVTKIDGPGYAGFEEGVHELLEANLRNYVSYNVVFDYN